VLLPRALVTLPSEPAAGATDGSEAILPAAPGSPGLADLDRDLRAELERIDREFEEAVRRRLERMRGGHGQQRG
jgi:hypothetical protein